MLPHATLALGDRGVGGAHRRFPRCEGSRSALRRGSPATTGRTTARACAWRSPSTRLRRGGDRRGRGTTRRGGRVHTVTSSVPTATYLAAVHVGRYRTTHLAGPQRRRRRARRDGDGPAGARRGLRPCFLARPRHAEDVRPALRRLPACGVPLVVTPTNSWIPLEAQGLAVFGMNASSPPRSGSWRTSWRTSGSATASEIARGATSGSTRASLLREWLWSEESGGDDVDACAAEHSPSPRGEKRDLLLVDPGRTTCSTTRSTSAGRSPCTLCAGNWATGSFLTFCADGPRPPARTRHDRRLPRGGRRAGERMPSPCCRDGSTARASGPAVSVHRCPRLGDAVAPERGEDRAVAPVIPPSRARDARRMFWDSNPW